MANVQEETLIASGWQRDEAGVWMFDNFHLVNDGDWIISYDYKNKLDKPICQWVVKTMEQLNAMLQINPEKS